MTVIIISGNITESAFWKKENLYVITGEVNVLSGVKLTIESGTKIGFLYLANIPRFPIIIFNAGSEVEAGCLCAYPVDQQFNKTSYSLDFANRFNIWHFLFDGTNNVEPPTKKSKIVIDKLCCNNLGGQIIFRNLSNDEIFINEINSNNSRIFFSNSNAKLEKIKNTNSTSGIVMSKSNIICNTTYLENLNIGIALGDTNFDCNKLVINKTNFCIEQTSGFGRIIINKELILCAFSLFNDKLKINDVQLTIKKCAKLITQGILTNNIQIETIDKNIPTERPYSVPYKASSNKLQGEVIFKLNQLDPPIPTVIPEKEGYKIITGEINDDTIWTNNLSYVIRDRVKINGKLTIEDNTKVLFFPNSFLQFSSKSQLIAGNVLSYPVTINYSRINRNTTGGWQFLGSSEPSNLTFTKLSIDSLYTSYFSDVSSNLGTLGTLSLTNSDFQWIGNIKIDKVFSEKTFLSINGENNIINTLSVKNNIYGLWYGFYNSGLGLTVNELEFTNVGYGIIQFDFNLTSNISDKFVINANNGLFGKIQEGKTFKILANKGSQVDLNGILLDSFNVKSDDTRIPQNKPYPVPYVVQVENLTADLSIDTANVVKSIPKTKNRDSKPHLDVMTEKTIFSIFC